MYAVITTGGKQYKVAPGDRIRVSKLLGEVNTKVNFSEVLMLSDGANVTIGQPKVDGANVEATILNHGREKKVVTMKFKKRKDYFRKRGFRAHYTKVEIGQIVNK
ncbi:MAG: 50S ribosomal protein L21 [Candidatus Wallbacteria bacterium GWC2_49_35]|jgi:large subunit ribosomal protein L21|uniref:Large ribosomal subunit protein bL21 n=1 Tax=Candidatus Wallbacteria bacterium GWC2_49_35 TaxID=1817813 RepID=A0A1F7WGA5_9BACT|nr:MAG: 50S ribosomal protein L21 [Candidatus Wallbacteria bacterium GWC2_49_35]